MKTLIFFLLLCSIVVPGVCQESKPFNAPARHFQDTRVQEFYDALVAKFPVGTLHKEKCFLAKRVGSERVSCLGVEENFNLWSVQYYKRLYGISSASRSPLPAALMKPVRPTTAVEIYHYVLSAFPLRETDMLRYELALPGGNLMSVPYTVGEEEANVRLHGYFNHPLPGVSQEDLGNLIALMSPASPKKLGSLQTSTDRGPTSPAYSITVQVNEIPDTATMFVQAGSEGISGPVHLPRTSEISSTGVETQTN